MGAALELRVRSFGYRDAREYWGIEDPATAFAHNALVGGTPGYRELVPDPQVPENPAQLGGWLTRNVLRPSMPLFDEARRVVHEDPRIRDTAAYSSVLAAVAAGESSPTKIGVLALARGSRPRTPGAPVAFIGEAKHRDRRPGLAELRRLQHLRDLLTAAGHDATDAAFGLFSATGFTDELAAEATASHGKILLATLNDLYGQPS